MGGGTQPMSTTAPSVSSKDLQINDLFWTLQGEGRFSGQRSLFVRLPFCNYECPWCDTEYNSFKNLSLDDFTNFLTQESARHAVITGGEPLFHKDLPRILKMLKEHNFYITCETNGSTIAPPEIDFVTCSPKAYTKNKLEPFFVHPDLFPRVNEWKYVVEKDFDFQILERHKPYNKNTFYSLSPEFTQMSESVSRIIKFIQSNPQWRLSLQTHKWINIP